jgi:hypothetical protein
MRRDKEDQYMSKPNRYFLGQDQSCHWYLIPVMYKDAWIEWCDIPESDERSWDVPFFAKEIDGYHSLTFTDPL